jgi:HEAT repeat protein
VAVAEAVLAHPRWDVRAAAARVLGASGGAANLAAVRAALRDEQDPVARAALADTAARLAER